MSENDTTPLSSEALIEDYREAVKKLSRARITLSFTILLVFLVYVFLIWTKFTGFRDEELPEFSATLNAEVAAIMPEIGQQVGVMMDRVVPVYSRVFAEEFDNNSERFLQVISDEFLLLEMHARNKTPEFEEAIALLVLEQEEAAQQSLAAIVPEKDLVRISEDYRNSLERHLGKMISQQFQDHMDVGEEIITKLQMIAESEQGSIPEGSQYTMGMIIELLGITMQDNALPGSNLTE